MACDPQFADTALFCERYGIDPAMSANAILVASKKPSGENALCIALSTTRLDVNHKVRDLMGVRKLSFAPADVTAHLTGMMIGGVTPFGFPSSIPIYVDRAVMQPEEIILGGGSRSWKIRVAPASLEHLPNLSVIDGLAQPILNRDD